jgi:hypothetical protein
MSHSAVLRAKIELALPAYYRASHRLWSIDAVDVVYPAYLTVLHTMIRATVPLMRAAIAECDRIGTQDPVARGVAEFLRHHVNEEKGHDEWLRQDLAAIGADPDAPLRAFPSADVAALVGSQYYWIHHYHPVCLLGHGAVLEGYPPSAELVDKLMARTGFPRSGFRALARHAVIDVRHRDEVMAAIDGLELTEEHSRALGVSALHTVRGIVTVVDGLAATLEERLLSQHEPTCRTHA